jgi:FAD dependent oxidoreductase
MPERCQVLVVGGGLGGIAAALAAARLDTRVVLTEPTQWLGGQLTVQAVPPDEHPWIEHTGGNDSYLRLRQLIRERYRRTRDLTPTAAGDRLLNPGACWVSPIGCEPREAVAAIDELLAPHRADGRIRVLYRHAPVAAEVDGDRVTAVTLRDTLRGEEVTITAPFILDATEEGDLLRLTGCEYVVGGEGSDVTGEPHNIPGGPDPSCQQAVTWCVALEHRPGENHTVDRPAAYSFWQRYRAPFWPGPQLGWATQEPETGRPLVRQLFGEGRDLWTFRRIRYAGHHLDSSMTDITVVNWPQIDYWLAPVVDVPDDDRSEHLGRARELTRSFVYWLQTEAPRPDGGTGWPGLRPAADVLGTDDGFAQRHYTRESRRIRGQTTVLETHVGVDARARRRGAQHVLDSVGVGSYRIDLHPTTCGRGYVDVAAWPFQIPLGALVPIRLRNLMPAAKNLATTHVTNGCFRLHPVEWSVGEAAGALAAFCLDEATEPQAVHADPAATAEFQALLDRLGVQRHWPRDIAVQAS